MAEPAVRRTPASGTDQSIGDLVSVAARDISQLVRYEMDLAKIELKSDVKRAGIGGALFAVGGFVVCLMLVLALFAYAYGLNEAFHLPLSACFGIAAGTCLGLAGIAALIGVVLVRRLTGISKTRRSLADGLDVLRRRRPAKKQTAAPAPQGSGTASVDAQARAG